MPIWKACQKMNARQCEINGVASSNRFLMTKNRRLEKSVPGIVELVDNDDLQDDLRPSDGEPIFDGAHWLRVGGYERHAQRAYPRFFPQVAA